MKAISLTQNALNIIQDNGHFALEQACKRILESQYDGGIVGEALHYYAKTVFPNVLPIFPALIHLSCKAVGVNPENTGSVAAAMMLITASGDIHDDIVDNSAQKFGRLTTAGKFGKDIALLAGDLLLIQGSTVLQNECDGLLSGQRKMISELIAAAMVEIVKAEALETSLWHKTNVTAEECFEVIRLKGGVAELHCRIGGVIGGADQKAMDNLTNYGRAIGVLSTLKEEFVDMSSLVELEHRLKHELLPYPMLCALNNKELKAKLDGITKKGEYSSGDLKLVVDWVLDSLEVKELKAFLGEFSRKELDSNSLLKGNAGAERLVVLLEALSLELGVV
jgi:heptaprenyl diphosphate synthase